MSHRLSSSSGKRTASCQVLLAGQAQQAGTLGQQLRLTRNLWYELPAFSRGFSVRPPPAIWPTMALHVLGTTCSNAQSLIAVAKRLERAACCAKFVRARLVPSRPPWVCQCSMHDKATSG